MPKATADLHVDLDQLRVQQKLLLCLISDPGIDEKETNQLRGLNSMVKQVINNVGNSTGITIYKQPQSINGG